MKPFPPSSSKSSGSDIEVADADRLLTARPARGPPVAGGVPPEWRSPSTPGASSPSSGAIATSLRWSRRPRRRKEQVVTSSGCVAQAWRDGTRLALLAHLLSGTTEKALGTRSSRPAGALCRRTGTTDVIDAHVALLARNGDTVLTSDPDDLRVLLRAARCSAGIVGC
jgi:hypothetical protein